MANIEMRDAFKTCFGGRGGGSFISLLLGWFVVHSMLTFLGGGEARQKQRSEQR